MSLAVSPLLTPMGRSDAGTDPAARALQALVQMASNADAPLEALVKAVAANNLTTLSVNGETLQVRLSVALPVGTALSIAPAPGNAAAVSVQMKPQAVVAQMAPQAPAQAASAAIVSAMTTTAVSVAPARMTRMPSPAVADLAAPSPEDPGPIPSPVPATDAAVRKPVTAGDARSPVAPSAAAFPAEAPEMPDSPLMRGQAVIATPQTPSEPDSAVAVARAAAPAPPANPAAPTRQGPVPAVVTSSPITPEAPAVLQTQPPLPANFPPATVQSAPGTAAPPTPIAPSPAAAPAPTAAAIVVQPGVATAALPIAAPLLQASGHAPIPMPTQTMATPTTSVGAPIAAAAAEPEPWPTRSPQPVRPAAIPYATAPRPGPTPIVALPPPDLAQAIATQQPLAPMLADAVKLAADPAMPPPLRAAAQQVVANAIDPAKAPLDAATLKQAVESAGVLRPLSPLASPDLANRLTALRNVLASLLGDDAVALPNERRRPASLPLRGDAPHAERSEMVPLGDEAPRGLANRLLGETDGALSRLKLLQSASQPADGRAPDPARPAEYRVEVPMLLGREATTLQFVFDREAQPPEQKKPRGWRMRFALNVAALGEVGADISILGAATQVTVWAGETETAALIEAMLPDLAPALAARGLEPGAIRMRHGRPGSVATGRLLDSAR